MSGRFSDELIEVALLGDDERVQLILLEDAVGQRRQKLPRFRPEFFEWVIGVSRPEYYVNMMRAWYFAEALAKQPAAATAKQIVISERVGSATTSRVVMGSSPRRTHSTEA